MTATFLGISSLSYFESTEAQAELSLLAFLLQLYCFQKDTVALLDPYDILHNPPKLCQTQIICITSKLYYKTTPPLRL